MDPAGTSSANSDLLRRALERSRHALDSIPDEASRSRTAQAIEDLESYIGLLGQTAQTTARYLLKLEFGDGRWDVGEIDLASAPPVGYLLDVGQRKWRVRGSQVVHPGVAGKPAREYLLCQPT